VGEAGGLGTCDEGLRVVSRLCGLMIGCEVGNCERSGQLLLRTYCLSYISEAESAGVEQLGIAFPRGLGTGARKLRSLAMTGARGSRRKRTDVISLWVAPRPWMYSQGLGDSPSQRHEDSP
jgi:hypothetical protein